MREALDRMCRRVPESRQGVLAFSCPRHLFWCRHRDCPRSACSPAGPGARSGRGMLESGEQER